MRGCRGLKTERAREQARVEKARGEAEYLRHASAELTGLAAEPGEEATLAERRSTIMQAEKVAAELRDVHATVTGEYSPMPALSAALRRLQRRQTQAPGLIAPAAEALDAALNALDLAGQALDQALLDAHFDPRELERVEDCLPCAPPDANMGFPSMRLPRMPKNSQPSLLPWTPGRQGFHN
jgi:DNA repair protein RecN (Recombination protein N)